MQLLSPIPECTLIITTKEDGNIDGIESAERVVRSVSNLETIPVVLPTHEHRTGVREITKENMLEVEFPGDILLTKERHVALVHQFADCVPVLLIDRKRKAVGFSHLGWKGLLTGGIQASVLSMEAKFDSVPEDLWIWIGPCIQKKSYTFEDAPAQKNIPGWEECVTKEDEKYQIDLPLFIIKECERLHIDPTRIINDGRDTFEEKDIFFSRTRYKSKHNPKDKGNFAVFAWIN